GPSARPSGPTPDAGPALAGTSWRQGLGGPAQAGLRRQEVPVMWLYGSGMGGWGVGLMSLGFLIFWALVICALLLLARSAGRSGRPPEPQPPGEPSAPAEAAGPAEAAAEQLLAERFARGEIDDQEYRRRLSTLREPSGVAAGHGA